MLARMPADAFPAGLESDIGRAPCLHKTRAARGGCHALLIYIYIATLSNTYHTIAYIVHLDIHNHPPIHGYRYIDTASFALVAELRLRCWVLFVVRNDGRVAGHWRLRQRRHAARGRDPRAA